MVDGWKKLNFNMHFNSLFCQIEFILIVFRPATYVEVDGIQHGTGLNCNIRQRKSISEKVGNDKSEIIVTLLNST